MKDYYEEYLQERESICVKDKRTRMVSSVRVGGGRGSVCDSYMSYAGACAAAKEKLSRLKYGEYTVLTGDPSERVTYSMDIGIDSTGKPFAYDTGPLPLLNPSR